MSDLETELAKARERVINHLHKHGLVGWDTPLAAFDAAANIAREAVAEKDAEIARLKAPAVDLTGKHDKHSANIAETLPLEQRKKYARLIINAINATVDRGGTAREQAINAVLIGLWLHRRERTEMENLSTETGNDDYARRIAEAINELQDRVQKIESEQAAAWHAPNE